MKSDDFGTCSTRHVAGRSAGYAQYTRQLSIGSSPVWSTTIDRVPIAVPNSGKSSGPSVATVLAKLSALPIVKLVGASRSLLSAPPRDA